MVFESTDSWETLIEARMQDVITLWDAAAWNCNKSGAFRLYAAAFRAQAAGNPAECLRRLDAAADLLGQRAATG